MARAAWSTRAYAVSIVCMGLLCASQVLAQPLPVPTPAETPAPTPTPSATPEPTPATVQEEIERHHYRVEAMLFFIGGWIVVFGMLRRVDP